MFSRLVAAIAAAAGVGILPAHATLTELTDAAQLDARGGHACVVTTGGAVKCWGANGFGQLGGGSSTFRLAAGPVTGLSSGAVAVAVNGGHSCAIVAGGSVKCWGANANGQLGDGTTTQSAVPVDVQGLPWPVAALTLGGSHTCALSAGGAVACWGANSSGQLGDGTTTQRLAPTPVVGLSSGVAAISAARSYSCAIATSGVVKCWGANSAQLGIGAPAASLTPADVAGLPGGATALSTGGSPFAMFHNETSYGCAIVAGTTKCWGNFVSGQNAGNYVAPSDISGAASGALAITSGGGRGFTGVLQGTFTYAQNCVVTAGNGVQCWGGNYCGIVGVPTGASCSSLGQFSELPPTDVPGLSSGIVSVSAASDFTCALQSAGTVKCWGSGYGNQPTAQMTGSIPQAITFGKAPFLRAGGTANLDVVGGGSANPITLTSQTPGTCSVSGTTVTALAATGTCTIAANQAGDGVYYDAAAQSTLSFEIDPRLANVSTRGQALAGNNAMIAGFVIGGTTSKTVAIVVTGPSLTAYGITNPALNPRLTLVRSSDQAVIATNDDWQSASNAAQLQADGFAPPDSTEAAILTTLPPGAYTAIIDAAPGTAVVGVYEADATEAPLVNLSTRGMVGTGNDVMIAGFVIQGSAPRQVAIVATGPSLAAYGISNPLANPTLTLVRSSDQAVIAGNDDWQAAANSAQLQAAGFAPTNALESAILVTLPPGAYTAVLSGVAGGTGIGVVGVYAVP